MKPQHVLAGLAAAAIAACWLAWPAAPPAPGTAAAAALPPASASPAAPAQTGRAWLSALPDTPETPAWRSMAEARDHGDPRSPPLQEERELRAAPTPAQLADPAAYRQFEQSRHAQVLASFAAAAQAELPRLKADVERARLAGIPAADIAKVERKIERMERVRRAIVEKGAVPD